MRAIQLLLVVATVAYLICSFWSPLGYCLEETETTDNNNNQNQQVEIVKPKPSKNNPNMNSVFARNYRGCGAGPD